MARPKKIETATDQPAGEPTFEVATEQPSLVTEQPSLVTAQPQAKAYVTVSPVYGPMHHPFQNIRIDGATPVEMDNWVEVQIDAGKLTLC